MKFNTTNIMNIYNIMKFNKIKQPDLVVIIFVKTMIPFKMYHILKFLITLTQAKIGPSW